LPVNIERGITRLMLVASALIVALSFWALIGGADASGVAAVAAIVLAGQWTLFFALRWVVHGFLHDPEPTVRRSPRIAWRAVKDWSILAIAGAAVAYVAIVILLGLWEGGQQLVATWPAAPVALWDRARHPLAMWDAIRSSILASRWVVWLRQTVGDFAAIAIVVALAILAAFGFISEWESQRVRRRQRRTLKRLRAHYATCEACQELPDSNDFPHDEDAYCPVGQKMYVEWKRS
jgi:hypothetical protein